MNKSIAVAEWSTVSSGIQAADAMVKAAAVEIVEAQTVCPGKYLVIIAGELSAVTAALAAAIRFGETMISSFVLGNPHESVLPAMYGVARTGPLRALGVLETYDAASALAAADVAVKTAVVELIELRIAKGMCGKSYLLLTGEVAAVEAAIAAAREQTSGMYLDSCVIARPSARLAQYVM
ncbi:MAG: BMC domain-containing protein [Clostridiales bacterium]|nr:BMC domain-containing protein [Clostridiales bacterium]